ncbi:MAG: glycerate kinase [archaeon GB-1867-005]|nr:glycerate kinase [Candidatus Culexmicrobium cathedralense]
MRRIIKVFQKIYVELAMKTCRFIKNFNELIEVSIKENAEARRIALELLEAGLEAANPKEAVKKHVKLEGDILNIGKYKYDLSNIGSIYVIGAGKASGKMAEALEEVLGERIKKGVVIVPRGASKNIKVMRIEVIEGDHPIPSQSCIEGALKIREITEEAESKDLIMALISGGGSSLLTLPADEVSIEDVITVTNLLLKCGADIKEINAVRKHISKVKGGQLAKCAYPAKIASLIISDVIGDPIDCIASGPTAPDPTTYIDAYRVLKKYELWNKVPQSIRKRIEKGLHGEAPETPKKSDPIFNRVVNFIIASNLKALKAMEAKAKQLNYNAIILTSQLEGEARHVGKVFASIIKEASTTGHPINPPAAIIAGGETTVTVTSSGIGGRNQELALGAALQIKGLKGIAIAAMGSDGIDGMTDAAGALVDGETIEVAEKIGIDPHAHLKNNDSYSFFKSIGGSLILTGLTGTNVNDFTVGVVVK